MYNYRSNQSALMSRCGTDLRHQYGIFGGKSQTSFTRNATRAGSEEGRLFSQGTDIAFIMSSSTSAWLLSPLECSTLRNKMAERFTSVSEDELCEKCIIKQLLNSVFA